MSCQYPQNSPATGYSKGCRCDRCRAGKRNTRGGTALEDRRPSMKARYPIPAGPVLRLVERWIVEFERSSGVNTDAIASMVSHTTDKANVPMSAQQVLAARVGIPTVARQLYAMRHGERAFLSWDTADRLVTACYGPHVWHQEPELRPFVDLAGCDVLDADEIRQWAIDEWATWTEDEKRAWRSCEPADFMPPALEVVAA